MQLKNLLPLKYIFFSLLLLTAVVSRATTQTDSGHIDHGYRFSKVVIDAGHGGKDPGAHGAFAKEKDVALGIALKLRNLINDEIPSLQVIMTRSSDKFIGLQQRSDIANESGANLFISIHCNSSPQKVGTRKGALILVYGYHRKGEQIEALRENESIYQEKDYQQKYQGYKGNDPAYFILLNVAMQKYREQSIRFGRMIDHEIRENDGRRSEGVNEQGLLVLAHSGMPNVLVETGFINNPSEEKYLASDEGQSEIARSILRALKKYKKDFER